jgi:hypothetical protein
LLLWADTLILGAERGFLYVSAMSSDS